MGDYIMSPPQSISQKICQGKTLILEFNFLGKGSLETIKLFLHLCSS